MPYPIPQTNTHHAYITAELFILLLDLLGPLLISFEVLFATQLQIRRVYIPLQRRKSLQFAATELLTLFAVLVVEG